MVLRKITIDKSVRSVKKSESEPDTVKKFNS